MAQTCERSGHPEMAMVHAEAALAIFEKTGSPFAVKTRKQLVEWVGTRSDESESVNPSGK